jgi:hypothetical protein
MPGPMTLSAYAVRIENLSDPGAADKDLANLRLASSTFSALISTCMDCSGGFDNRSRRMSSPV